MPVSWESLVKTHRVIARLRDHYRETDQDKYMHLVRFSALIDAELEDKNPSMYQIYKEINILR